MGSSAISTTSRRSPRVRRGFVIAFVAVSILFAIVLAVRALQRPEGLESAARNILSAYIAGDAATLMKYVAREEKEATGLDEASLQELLDRVFLPALEGCQLKGIYRDDTIPSAGDDYDLVADFECEGGIRVGVAAFVYAGDSPVAPHVAYHTVFTALTAYGNKAYPGLDWDVKRYKAYLDMKPILKSLRLKKVWLEFKERALSWDEVEARLRRQAMLASQRK